MRMNWLLRPRMRFRVVSTRSFFVLAVGVCPPSVMPFVASAQQTICPAGQSSCGSNACFNLQSDPQHCGSCGTMCSFGTSCVAGTCVGAGPQPVFACKFTSGKLSGSAVQPTGLQLTGPPNTPCSDNYGSSGIQVITGMQAICVQIHPGVDGRKYDRADRHCAIRSGRATMH
jgi:hypothetical protein